jgi:conjugation system TraG family ATPase
MQNHLKTAFKLPYTGIHTDPDGAILYGDCGDFSMVFAIRNPVLQYGADPEPYQAYHLVLSNMIKVLGEGYLIQKQDVLFRRQYENKPTPEFLQQRYHAHFEGREYTSIRTYLIVTRQVKKGAFYVYDPKATHDFKQHRSKIMDLLSGAGLAPHVLGEDEIHRYVSRLLAADFSSPNVTLNNIRSGDQQLETGDKAIRSISLINTDAIDLPEKVGTYISKNDGNLRNFPMDNLSFLHHVPDYDFILYNQVIEIPNQQLTLKKLELKRKRHSGVSDPANLICVEDIDQLLVDVARENQMLVHAHYNLLVCAPIVKIGRSANFIEAALFQQGIIPSRNAYNQLELFRTALPGNGVALKSYDWFLTTSDAALCFFFKESLLEDDPSDFLIRFTDRQGIPVAIDPADFPMRTGRINNRNKFVLGGSGSGKSFFMNALLEQYCLYNVDIVIIDTGHSYSGLCAYFGGKYHTYTEKHPITMNPFDITEAEYNIEKKDFLKTLIGLLLKGAEGTISPVEDTLFSNVISAYYAAHFMGGDNVIVSELNFDTFYNFSVLKIHEIKTHEKISFDLDEYRYVLKKFCRGEEYGSLLNEKADSSLFTERFIVFEIDAIKEHKVLFPIVTLIIMDVFLQKMRHRKDQRKALVVEEAWKAISSPLMAGYLLYLYKTVRKFWGEAIVVTQELSDILGNAVVKDSILNNSDTICLLDQSKFKENYADIAKLLSLTPTEQQKIFTINQLDNKAGRGKFKEVYIRRGSSGEVYGVEVSLHQYLTYTTEKPEKNAIEAYVSRYGDYPAALNEFVADFEQSGLKMEAFVQLINRDGPIINRPATYFKPDLL